MSNELKIANHNTNIERSDIDSFIAAYRSVDALKKSLKEMEKLLQNREAELIKELKTIGDNTAIGDSGAVELAKRKSTIVAYKNVLEYAMEEYLVRGEIEDVKRYQEEESTERKEKEYLKVILV